MLENRELEVMPGEEEEDPPAAQELTQEETESLWVCLMGCRACAIIAVVILSSLIAAKLSGSAYAEQMEACRMMHLPLSEAQRIDIGGGEIGRVSYSVSLFDVRCSEDVTQAMRQDCYATADISSFDYTWEHWEPFTGNENCIVPCHEDEYVLCHCENNPWATTVKVGDLPKYCRNGQSVPKAEEMGFLFIEGDDTVSGFLVWLPVITWGLIRLMISVKDLVWYFGRTRRLGDFHPSSACAELIIYVSCVFAPNILIRPVSYISIPKSEPSVIFAPVSHATHGVSYCALAMFVCFTFRFYCDYVGATSPENEHFSETLTCAALFCGGALAFIPCAWEVASIIKMGMPLGFTFTWALNWPGLSISAIGTALRVSRFFLGCMDVLVFFIDIVKNQLEEDNAYKLKHQRFQELVESQQHD